jgi:outer membrane protein assembly factor BamB
MQQNLFIGSNGHVCAIDTGTGVEIWRTRLQKGLLQATASEDVSVIVREEIIYAGCQGHLFAISGKSGEILWHNDLKGLGYNDISLAFEGHSIQFLQKIVHQNGGTGAGN